jgi:hypothetical protein
MAKLIGPLFSLAAHGTLGKSLNFHTVGAKTLARFQKKQKDYVNDSRARARIKFIIAARIWANLTPEQKQQLQELS